MQIIDSYTNDKGNIFNIRDIHYYDKSELIGNMGIFKAETRRKKGLFFASSSTITDGVYIYQSYYNKDKALRIYQDYADYKYTCHDDDKLVSKLQEVQKLVKLTEFPTGIVTLENKIIGQEIPYYDESISLDKLINDKKVDSPLNIYKDIINILKELVNVGIIYCDIHACNFMINLENMVSKLIDFDSYYIFFDDDKQNYKYMLDNLKRMITYINQSYNIAFDNIFDKTEKLEEVEEYIFEKQLKKM